jgi:hypothetical protein
MPNLGEEVLAGRGYCMLVALNKILLVTSITTPILPDIIKQTTFGTIDSLP